MKIPSFRRIFKTDYKSEDQELVEKLAFSINVFNDNMTNAMNHQMSLADNIQCTLKTFNVKVTSGGEPATPVSFSLTSNGKLTGITVLSATNTTNPNVYPTSAPFITYSLNNNIVTIKNVAGLPVDNVFSLTIVAYTN